MRRLDVIFLMVTFSGWMCVAPAQEKKEPPPHRFSMPVDSSSQNKETVLPKIDLPEFVITGNESIDLPKVSKTSVDAQWVDDSSLRRSGPGVREATPSLGGLQKDQIGLSNEKKYNGRVEAGYGSFQTPYFDGWFGSTYPSADFLLQAGYKSSEGHVTNADFRDGNASLLLGTHLGEDLGVFSGNRVQAKVGMDGSSYRLYGSLAPTLERTVTNFDAEVGMNSTNIEMIPYSAKLIVESSTMKDSSRSTETSAGIELGTRKPFGDFELRGNVALWRSAYSGQSATVDPYYSQFAGSVGYRIANVVDIRGGAAFHLVRGSDTKTMGRLYPRLGVSWYASDAVTVYAKFEPEVQRAALASMVRSSPYVVVDLPIRHPERFVDFSLGVEAGVSRTVRSRFSMDYTRTHNVPIYVDPDSSHVWNVTYAGTTEIAAFNAELYADLTNIDNLGASFSVRSNKNSSTSSQNPYFPVFLGSASYRHLFPFGLTVGSSLRIVGRQSTDLTGGGHLPAFAVWDIRSEYEIVPRWSFIFALNNILDQKETWWDGYSGIQRTVSLGTSFAW